MENDLFGARIRCVETNLFIGALIGGGECYYVNW